MHATYYLDAALFRISGQWPCGALLPVTHVTCAVMPAGRQQPVAVDHGPIIDPDELPD